jgi:hypothetical protein
MKLSKKRTCDRCKALMMYRPHFEYCSLGFKFDKNFKPLYPCYKPLTNTEHEEAKELIKNY